MSERVAVIDYGMGNLHSAAKALEAVSDGQQIVICVTPDEVRAADRVVFPGVGAMRDCMAELQKRGLDDALCDVVKAGKPLLGVCVGMQSLMTVSEENNGVPCLGLFEGKVARFPVRQDAAGLPLKVPHMGWNRVTQSAHPLWNGIPDNARFYFVHSYRVPELPDSQVTGRCEYGESFVAACAQDNVFAVQFHPEKSAPHGLTLLKNFLNWKE